MVVGSGGSLSAAQFCADWHQLATGQLGKAVTPLEAVAAAQSVRGSAVAIYSAGGRNADIRRAFRAVLDAEPSVSWLVLGDPHSPLVEAASKIGASVVFAARGPAGRDGFLATNSLLAFTIITCRAYAAVMPAMKSAVTLPTQWNDFAEDGPRFTASKESVFWHSKTIVVLHGYATRAAAIDFESKCTEAGLLHVQVADYRNFAHGRHNWLTKHSDSAVIALVAPEDESIARRTLGLLPRAIRRATVEIPFSGPLGGIRALIDVMRLVARIGSAKGIDPGRPGVQPFGGKLYSFRGIDLVRSSLGGGDALPGMTVIDDDARYAIERKVRRPLASLSTVEQSNWADAYINARNALTSRDFGAVVFDYDGTLVDSCDRWKGPSAPIIEGLLRLLNGGLAVGVATGRGQSVAKQLRAHLPKAVWHGITIGYYNGGVLARLADESLPEGATQVGIALAETLEVLRRSKAILSLADLSPRSSQITLAPFDVTLVNELWDTVHGVLIRAGLSPRIVKSTHAIDILAPGVTKIAVVDAVRPSDDASAPVLRFGDCGAWPGNDSELLVNLDGISVGDVSADPIAAWNFSPAGLRGARAMMALLERLTVGANGAARFTWESGA
jgi:hypothetical protein